MELEEALGALRRGSFVLVYDADGREAETDLVIASQFATPPAVRALRTVAGGLICTTVPPEAAESLGLPFMEEVIREASSAFPVLKGLTPRDLKYDKRSSFSLTINHRETFTGVTDRDRSLTVQRFAQLVAAAGGKGNGWAQESFGREFRSPGHVTLLRASDDLLVGRRGHTELATALVTMADLIPSATICEMVGDDGRAVAKEDAKKYARGHNLPFLEGREILGAWEKWSGSWPPASST
jgi:3,4-dihydroxy 2-butanone 4-phosphate synthase